MHLQLRNYLLFHIFLYVFLNQVHAQSKFTQESLNSLREVIHQFEGSSMPDPVMGNATLANLPCMAEVKRMLQIHYDKMKSYPRNAVYASGKGNPSNPGFLEMMETVDQKIITLSNQLGNFNNSMTAPGVFVYSALEVSANYGDFVSNFTGKDIGEHPQTIQTALRELYDVLQPMKKAPQSPGSFNYMTIYYGSDNMEGCRGTESGRLFFKQIDYPQIIWEIEHTYILNCNCATTSGDNVKRINVKITADINSNLSSQSISDLRFQSVGQPTVTLQDAACCGNTPQTTQPVTSTSGRKKDEPAVNTSTQHFAPTYTGDTSAGSFQGGSGIIYKQTLGGKLGFGYRKGGEYSICAGAQYLTPIGNPICNYGSGQFLGGLELMYDRTGIDDDFASQTEQWFCARPKIMITKGLGPNVDLLTGLAFPIGIGTSSYEFSDSTTGEEVADDDLFRYGGELFVGFSFIVCNNIFLQANANVFEYTRTTISPGGNADLKFENDDWGLIFNKRNPLEVSLNFPF